MTYSNVYGHDEYNRAPHTGHAKPRAAACPAAAQPRAAALQPRPGAASARRRFGLGSALFALVLVGALAATAWFTLPSLAASSAPGTESGAPQSTPRENWRAGEVPKLYQRDAAWVNASYAEGSFGDTGCGPTCLTMVYVALTGRTDMTPADMGALSERLGCASADGTAWAFMTEGAAEKGLLAEELPADEASVRQALVSGSPVICSVGPGDFTSTGHFIVLTGVDEHGQLIIRDPNSPERTAQAWDFDTVLRQCRNLWAYTAA